MQTPRETESHSTGEGPAPGAPTTLDTLAPEALPPGSRLDEFEIVRVLGAGGFGIVYLALDQVLLRYVAIKEFIPTALAGRTPGGAVAVRSPQAAETFEIGLDSFYNEGRLLARFDNPSLVRVFRFWKANGTAYMAMQYYPGQTLRSARRQMPALPDEAWFRLFVDRLLGALGTLHAQGVYHRDIAPDNILLLPDGHPVILDFGSARRVIGDRTQSLTAILKPNYSPVEQYADDAGMRQGGYTDLYALGGTVYFMLTGKEPTPAVMRAVRDSFPLLAGSPIESLAPISHQFLAAIDWALGVSPDDRPQTVAQLRAALGGDIQPPPPSDRHGVLISDPNQAYDASRASAKTEVAAPRPAVAAAAAPGAAPTARHEAGAPARQRQPAWIVMAGVASATVAAALLWAMLGAPSRSAAEPPAAAASSVPLAAAPAAPLAAPDPEPPVAASKPGAPVVSAREPPRIRWPQEPAPPRPAPPSVPALPPRALPNRAPTTAPAGASPCAGMNLFARAACLYRTCNTPQWSAHPQCVEARRIAEQRQRRMEQ